MSLAVRYNPPWLTRTQGHFLLLEGGDDAQKFVVVRLKCIFIIHIIREIYALLLTCRLLHLPLCKAVKLIDP